MIIRFRRFTRPGFLKTIRRELLARFLREFEPELGAQNLSLPDLNLAEEAYFGSLARLLSAPEGLPERLTEALVAVDEMASPDGQEQLEAAVAGTGLPLTFDPRSTLADLAIQVWLAAPELLAGLHNQRRLRRLTAFEIFGSGLRPDQRRPFSAPDQAALEALAAALEPWFARHHRGCNTVRVEVYPFPGEFWFVVRHGDTFSPTPKVEEQKTEILHFRPEKDDVVVYVLEHDELRINARTKGERDLYVRTFGLCLGGRPDYFDQAGAYTLEPLRTEGPDALDTGGLEGLRKVVLRELEVAWDRGRHEVITWEAEDIFRAAPASVAPHDGRLARAAFDFHFADSRRPRPVEIRLPNLLKLGRHCDFQLVDRFLCQRGFRRHDA